MKILNVLAAIVLIGKIYCENEDRRLQASLNEIKSNKKANNEGINTKTPDINNLSNFTFTINKTTNNTDCIPECYLNCAVHFPDEIEQKYCIINVCHCEIIDESSGSVNSLSLLVQGNGNVSDIKEYHYKLDEKVERFNYYILITILMVIMIPPWVYFTFELVKYWNHPEELGYEFPYKVNEYMLLGEYPQK